MAMDAVTLKVTSEPEPQWDTAPVGAFPCIPACAAGAPDDMFTPSEDAPPVSRTIVRIAVNMAAGAGVKAHAIVNRGAAIVSLIDRIQLSGRRVELVAFRHVEKESNRFISSVTVKRPEEPIDMDRIGLAFATPIMLRRFFWRVMEFTVPEAVEGYGRPADFPEEYSGFHLTIPKIFGSEYETPEDAAATVAKLWEAAAV
jgi:hypothetical protein